MLPESTTKIRAAPAMLHAGARDFLVHRQYELAPPPSPPAESAAERRARLMKPPPPPSPPEPPHSPPPSAEGFIAEDVGYRYAGEEAEDGAAASELAAIEALSGRFGSGRMHQAYELANEVPAAWLTAVAMFVCCLLAICGCICLRSRRQRRRRRAQLEDVQTVFHTETWRKLE